MDDRAEFLNRMIEILTRLNDTCIAKGEPLLASVLAIAKGEAEDALRHAEDLAALNALRVRMSSTTTWRQGTAAASELPQEIAA